MLLREIQALVTVALFAVLVAANLVLIRTAGRPVGG
jgi:hypothetical protein